MFHDLEDWRHTPIGRRVVRVWRCARSPRELWHRQRVAADTLSRSSPSLRVDPLRGFVRFQASDLCATTRHNEQLEELLLRTRGSLERDRRAAEGKHRLVVELLSDAQIDRSPWLVDFALQEAYLLAAIEYLGTVPYLARISLAVSFHVPEWTAPNAFQRFHVDNDDFRHLKVYFHPRSVDERHGPLSFLPADVSERVLAALAREGQPVRRSTTFQDSDVFRHCDPSDLVVLNADPGSGAIVDLSRCLHFGSRVRAGHERVVYGLTFLRYQRLHENPSNHVDSSLARGDALRRLALRGPVEHPSGRFYPELERALASDPPASVDRYDEARRLDP